MNKRNPDKHPRMRSLKEEFNISADFTDNIMRRIEHEKTPKASIWHRLDLWEIRWSASPSSVIAVQAAAVVAGLFNLAGLYLFLLGI